MKQVFINSRATTMFFKDEDTIKDIVDWINLRMHDSDNPFNLNEQWNARASHEIDGSIHIIGDEDMVEIILEKITPINLSVF